MNVLELFSGTGSVGKVCNQLGWNVVSVDLELPATHQCDIMDFDYKQYPKDYFSIVWGSPPCVNYSKLQDAWIGRKRKGVIYTKEVQENEMKEADKLVLKTFEIIDYFKPELWCIENPQTGRMKEREIMKDIPFYDVDYCMYSDWGYRKRTRVWTNKINWDNKLCDGSGACGNMIEISTAGAKRHDTGKPLKCDTRKLHSNNCGKTETLQTLRKLHKNNCGNTETLQCLKTLNAGSGTNRLDRYRVPEDLIFSLFLD